MDDDVDRILQLAVELSSYVLQTPNVYIAEVLLDKTQANNTGPDDRASSTSCACEFVFRTGRACMCNFCFLSKSFFLNLQSCCSLGENFHKQ